MGSVARKEAHPLLGFIYFFIKTFIFIMLFILLRGALPRPRYDQVMAGGWKFCHDKLKEAHDAAHARLAPLVIENLEWPGEEAA